MPLPILRSAPLDAFVFLPLKYASSTYAVCRSLSLHQYLAVNETQRGDGRGSVGPSGMTMPGKVRRLVGGGLSGSVERSDLILVTCATFMDDPPFGVCGTLAPLHPYNHLMTTHVIGWNLCTGGPPLTGLPSGIVVLLFRSATSTPSYGTFVAQHVLPLWTL